MLVGLALGVLALCWFFGWMLAFVVLSASEKCQCYDPSPTVSLIWVIPPLVVLVAAGVTFGLRYARPLVWRERVPVTEDLRKKGEQ